METHEPIDQAATQQHIVSILAIVQIIAGIGVASGGAVGALLVADLSTDSLSGLATTASVIGAAIFAIPISRIMDARGRGPGLIFAYASGFVGAILIVVGAVVEFLPLALIGLFGAGAGMAATLQSRYAATDLATAERRASSLSMVVWATTIGSVIGPNLASPMGRVAEQIDIPSLAGPYLLTMLVFVICGLLIALFLKPDPLLTARAISGERSVRGTADSRSLRQSISYLNSIPPARLALLSMAVGQTVMVAVMSMTPVHLRHSDAGLRIIGFVISGHIAGMYIASPLVGFATDRFGRRPIIITGGLILLTAFIVAGTASGAESFQLGMGLFLLGLGWSCTMIAGATLLTDSIPMSVRPTVQGSADLIVGISGASASLIAGLVVGLGSYALLNILAAIVVVPLIALTIKSRRTVPIPSPSAS